MQSLGDNPELSELEATLRAEAEASDRGEAGANTVQATEKTDAGERATSGEQTKDKSEGQDAASADASGDGKGKETVDPKDSTSAEGEQTKEQDQDKDKGTKYQKAKKESERLDRSWKALNAEKERIAKERAEIDRLAAEAKQRQEQAQQKAVQQPVERGDGIMKYTPEELEQAAKDFSDEGNEEMAQKALAAAKQVRANQAKLAQERQTAEVRAKADAIWKEVVKENPDLANDESELAKDVVKVFQQNPVLSSYPEGVRDAVRLSKLRAQAAKAESLGKRVSELEAENKKLRESTSLNSTPPNSGPSAPVKFEDMTLDQQEKYLEKQMLGKGIDALVGSV